MLQEWLRGLTREIIGSDSESIEPGDPVDWVGGWILSWRNGGIVPIGEPNLWEDEHQHPELATQTDWLVNPAICQALRELAGHEWTASYPIEPDHIA